MSSGARIKRGEAGIAIILNQADAVLIPGKNGQRVALRRIIHHNHFQRPVLLLKTAPAAP
jgi:hypothetical protein